MKNRIAIILVTYNPNLKDLFDNIKSYVNQVELLVIVDNSDRINIEIPFKKYTNIHLIKLGENLGIAKAQNLGFNFAINCGMNYFIEIDQDSRLPQNYVFNILESFNKIKKIYPNIAGIGPLAVNKVDNSTYHNRESKNNIIDVNMTLSSGFLSSREILKIVGMKEEALFIDLVDWEWCWRAKSKGYQIFVDTNINIQHLLGDGHKNFIFFKIGIPSPLRHYYQYRNSILISKRDYIPLKWKVKRFFIHLIKPFFILFFYDKKALRLKFLIKGVIDGIINKYGRIKVK